MNLEQMYMHQVKKHSINKLLRDSANYYFKDYIKRLRKRNPDYESLLSSKINATINNKLSKINKHFDN